MSGTGLPLQSIAERSRRPLLSSCALATAMVALGHAPVQAQSYQATELSSIGAAVNNSAPGRTVVTVTAPTAIVNWQPTDNAAGSAPINFQSYDAAPGAGAVFESNGQVTDYTVLNRILPTGAAVGRSIQFNGRTTSFIGSETNGARGGNIWFYSPGGIIVGSQAVFDIGSLLLTTADLTDSDFLDGGTYSFRSPTDSRAKISIQPPDSNIPGAGITALTNSSYVAIVAPRIDMAGRVQVDGSAAYVAAEAADITINNGLFDIGVVSGSAVDGTAGDDVTLRHSGSTTGPAAAGGFDQQAIYMVAIPKNDAITMLVGGTIGFAPASQANVVNGVVVLSAGQNLLSFNTGSNSGPVVFTNGSLPAALDASIDIDGGFFTSATTAYALTDITADGGAGGRLEFQSSFDDANFYAFAGRTARITARAGETIEIDGELVLRATGEDPAFAAIFPTTEIVAQAGSSVTVRGQTSLDATAYTEMGNRTGGTARVTGTNASLRFLAGLGIFANGSGGIGPLGSAAGAGTGGTASIALTGGSLDVANNLELYAQGYGATDYGRDSNVDGGLGTGGNASVLLTSAVMTVGGATRIDATGYGGGGNTGGSGGNGVGGTASLETAISTVAAGFSTDGLEIIADGRGGVDGGEGVAPINGGDGIGGRASLLARNGTVTTTAALISAAGVGHAGLSASAFFDLADGGNGGSGLGGLAVVGADGGTINVTGSALTVSAFGRGGDGGDAPEVLNDLGNGSGTSGSAGDAGSAIGGTAYLNATGGGTISAASAETIVDASAIGGSGGNSAFGAGGNGGAATGGGATPMTVGASVLAGAGTTAVSVLRIDASATAGSAGSGNSSSSAGGVAIGGNAALSVTGDSLSAANVDLLAHARGGDGNFGVAISDGGDATGGKASLSVLAGDLSLTALTFRSDGQGGTGRVAGDGIGGRAIGTIGSGTVSFGGSMTIDARGVGGSGVERGGDAEGGDAGLTVQHGGAPTGISSLTLYGDATGGSSGSGGIGGGAIGGSADVTVDGSTLSVGGGITLSAAAFGADGSVAAGTAEGGDTSLTSRYGGSITAAAPIRLDSTAQGGNGRNGASGTGGKAEVTAQSGSITMSGSLHVLADGGGGQGAFDGDGGIGTGGSAGVSLTSLPGMPVGALTVTSGLYVSAGGFGGIVDNFGSGTSGAFGSGGAGKGGSADIFTDGTFAVSGGTYVIATGSGGRSSTGGAAGAGMGGMAGIAVTGGILSLDTLEVLASGTGASNFDSGYGSAVGGDGGAGIGGTARLIGGDAAITAETITLDAAGLGGSGAGGVGASGDPSLTRPAGNGGAGSGGQAGLQVARGSFAATGVTLNAEGRGGAGATSDDLSSAGAGGGGAGGTASIHFDGSTFDDDISLLAQGSGGDGGAGMAGGAAAGGTAAVSVTNGGNIALPNMTIAAAAIGGAGGVASAAGGGDGGAAAGGTIELAARGQNSVLDAAGLLLDASAQGGSASTGGTGGSAAGGFAIIRAELGIVRILGPENIGATVQVEGHGGSGAAGGAGSGGSAELIATGGTIELGDTLVHSSGFGGDGGVGAGGAASIIAKDDPALGNFGTVTAGYTTIEANGVGGRIEIRNTSQRPEGSIAFAGLDASALGSASGSAVPVIDILADGGAIHVTDDAFINSGGDVHIAAAGTGSLAVGGNLDIRSGFVTRVEHSDQPGTPADTIRAQSIGFDAGTEFTSGPGSVIRADDTILIRASGNIRAEALVASHLVSARSGGNLSVGQVTADGAVSSGATTLAEAGGGHVTLHAGDGSAPGFSTVPLAASDIEITGIVSATNEVAMEAGRDVRVTQTGTVRSNNRISINAGDDIVVDAGGDVSAALAPLADPTDTGHLDLNSAAGLFLSAGRQNLAYTPLSGNVATIRAEGRLSSGDRGMFLAAGAATAASIEARSLIAEIDGSPEPGAVQSNDGGALGNGCFQGNVCVGQLDIDNMLVIGGLSGASALPMRIQIGGAFDARQAVLRAKDNVVLGGEGTAFGGAELLRIQSLGGTIDLPGGVTLKSDATIELLAAGGINGASATVDAGLDAAFHVGAGDLALGTLRAGRNLATLDADGNVVVINALDLPGAISIGSLLTIGQGDANLIAPNGISVGEIASTGSVALDSSGGDVTVATDLAAGGLISARGANVTLRSLEDISIHFAEAFAGTLDIGSGGGIDIERGLASQDIRLGTAGNMRLRVLDAGRAIIAHSLGDLQADDLRAVNDIELRAQGDLLVADALVAADTGNLLLAGGDPFPLQGTGAYLLDGDATISGTVSAGNGVHINGGGDVFIQREARIRSDGSIRIHSGDDIMLDGGALVSPGDDVAFSAGLLRAGAPNLTANEASTLVINGAVEGITIELSSEAIDIGAAGRVGSVDTQTLSFVNSGSGQMVLGGAGNATGYSLASAEVGRAQANAIRVVAPVSSSAGSSGPAIVIQDLVIRGSATDAPGEFASLVGDNASFRVQTGGNVRVEGGVAIGSAGPNDLLAISAGQRIEVVTPTASLAVNGPQGSLAGGISLAANRIYVTTAQAAQDIDALSGVDAKDGRLALNDGASSAEGFLRANALIFHAGAGLYIQNSGQDHAASGDRAGVTAGSGGMSIVTGGTAHTEVIINGRQVSSDGGFVTGADLIPLLSITGTGQASMANLDPRSTANGCLIVGLSCRFEQAESSGPPVQDVIREIVSPAEGVGSDSGLVPPVIAPLIQLAEFSPFSSAPMIDEPVTGAGNENFWAGGSDADEPDDIDVQVTGTRNDSQDEDDTEEQVTGTRKDDDTPQ